MPILYHYTTIEGLKGIVESKCLWATNYRYLNDTEEIRHGLKITKELVADRLKNTKSDETKPFLKTISVHLDAQIAFEGNLNYYVTSFSSAPDLLSQWRGYCPNSDGVCIAFLLEGETLNSINKPPVILQECQYVDNPEQLPQKVMKSLTNCVAVFLNSGFPIAEEQFLKSRITVDFMKTLIQMAISIKHPSFKEEKESRLICGPTGMLDQSILFRPSHQMLVPYQKIRLTPNDNVSLPIVGVIVGPSPKKALSISSVESFLLQNKVRIEIDKLRNQFIDSPFEAIVNASSEKIIPPPVIGSKIPFENW